MKYTKYLLIFTFVISSCLSCFGQDKKAFINDKTLFVCYANIGYLYNKLKQDLISGYEKQDPTILEALKSFKKIFANVPNQKLSRMSDDELIKTVKNWDNNGFLVPNGLLRFSVSSDRSFFFSLDAKLDTNYILDVVCSSFPENALEKQENNGNITVKLPIGATINKSSNGIIKINCPDSFDFEIKPNGLTLDRLSDKNIPNKSWNTLLNNLSDENCFMHTELDVKTLYALIKDNEFFKRPNLTSFMGFASKTSRVRVIGKKNNYMMIAAITDEEVRKEYLNKYSQMIKNNSGNQVLNIVSQVWKDIKIIDKSPWIGSQTNSNSEFISSMGLVGLVAFVSPLIQGFLDRLSIVETDEARGRKCLDNLKMIVIYSENNDGSIFEDIKTEDAAKEVFQMLIDKGFMKSLPKCPQSNKVTYFTKPDMLGSSEFYCPVHGTLSKPNFILTEQKVDPNSPEGQKKECFINCETLNRRISGYNFQRIDNKDQQIRTMKKGEEAKEVIDKLIKEGLLKSVPICPTTGKMSYFSDGDLENFGVIECEVHGTPFEKKSEFEKEEFKKRHDRTKCHFNLQWLNSFIERYNSNNEDQVTIIEKGNAEEILKKVYGDNEIPVCPTTGKPSYFSEGDLTEGYHVQCEIHGLPKVYDK